MIFSLFDNLSPFSFSASSIEYKALGVALIALTAVITTPAVPIPVRMVATFS